MKNAYALIKDYLDTNSPARGLLNVAAIAKRTIELRNVPEQVQKQIQPFAQEQAVLWGVYGLLAALHGMAWIILLKGGRMDMDETTTVLENENEELMNEIYELELTHESSRILFLHLLEEIDKDVKLLSLTNNMLVEGLLESIRYAMQDTASEVSVVDIAGFITWFAEREHARLSNNIDAMESCFESAA